MQGPSNDLPPPAPGDPTPGERQWEAALSTLRPAGPVGETATAFRDRLMFRAGEAAGRRAAEAARAVAGRQVWLWRGGAAASLALSIGLCAKVLEQSRRPGAAERVVYVPVAPPPAHRPPEDPVAPAGPTEAAGAARLPLVFARLGGPESDYLSTREAVLRWGVRVLPAAAGSGGAGPPSPTVRDVPSPSFGSPAGADLPGAGPLDGLRRLRQWLLPNDDRGQS